MFCNGLGIAGGSVELYAGEDGVLVVRILRWGGFAAPQARESTRDVAELDGSIQWHVKQSD